MAHSPGTPPDSWSYALRPNSFPANQCSNPCWAARTALANDGTVGATETTDPYAIVRKNFASVTGEVEVEKRFRDYLHRGVTRD